MAGVTLVGEVDKVSLRGLGSFEIGLKKAGHDILSVYPSVERLALAMPDLSIEQLGCIGVVNAPDEEVGDIHLGFPELLKRHHPDALVYLMPFNDYSTDLYEALLEKGYNGVGRNTGWPQTVIDGFARFVTLSAVSNEAVAS